MSIGEFARLSRLSPKALRHYDQLGLLRPARVDPESGYRWYGTGQVEQARLVAMLRQIGVPLAQITVILQRPARAAAELLGEYWSGMESEHAARRELAGYLVDRLNGKRHIMFEVAVRDMPARSLLSTQQHVRSDQLMAVGRNFTRRLREEAVPRPEGIAGAPFVIFHGEVDEDNDGPIEWCWPIPENHATVIAARLPDLTLRTEAAHQEAFIHLDAAQATNTRTTVLLETLLSWAGEHQRHPTGASGRSLHRPHHLLAPVRTATGQCHCVHAGEEGPIP